MNCHADVDTFQRHAKPVMAGNTKIPGIHLEQERISRMLQVLLHDHSSIGEWKSMQLRNRIVTEFELPEGSYSRNQIIYDIRKLRAHGIAERIRGRNCYRLTDYGIKVAVAFTLMRKRIYGPLHYSLFHHQPDAALNTNSKLEKLYRRLDENINEIQAYLSQGENKKWARPQPA